LIVGMKKSNNAESAMVKPLLSPSVAGAQIVWSF